MPYKNFQNKERGFTLIEMLIVVAIIGSISTVVLTRTKGSKERGADTAVKAGLQQVIAQAENFYSLNEDNYGESSYSDGSGSDDGACSDGKITSQLGKIDKQSASGNDVQCSSSDQKIAVSASLKGGGGTWCVDNDGYNDYGSINDSACEGSSE